jgi:hypothetical protein
VVPIVFHARHDLISRTGNGIIEVMPWESLIKMPWFPVGLMRSIAKHSRLGLPLLQYIDDAFLNALSEISSVGCPWLHCKLWYAKSLLWMRWI